MDSTEFRNFMYAQVAEMCNYINSLGGSDPDQVLAHEWAGARSEKFRQKWNMDSRNSALNFNSDSSVL
jgi:hypothetical protein